MPDNDRKNLRSEYLIAMALLIAAPNSHTAELGLENIRVEG